MIAKRRTYAQIQSYLTPPFRESELRNTYRQLNDAIDSYNKAPNAAAAQKVKQLTDKMEIAAELGLSKKAAYTADYGAATPSTPRRDWCSKPPTNSSS